MKRGYLVFFGGLCALVCLATGSAAGEVTSVGESGFSLKIEVDTAASRKQIFHALVQQVDQWWSSDHTWSGKAANLKMDTDRGWFLERLPDGGWVRHMDIVFCQPEECLRLTGGLGPLQEMGLNGALTIRLSQQDGKVKMVWIYQVHGHAPGGFAELAPIVDQVLSEQAGRLVKFTETGKVDE